MISAFLLLLCNSLFLSLHLSGGTGSFPKPLTAAQEREYLRRCAEGDMEARNLLVEHNLRLVAHIMKKYYTQADDQEDLISIGTIGLIKAVNTFRADKGIRLATYASRCIENAILSQRNKRRLRRKSHERFGAKWSMYYFCAFRCFTAASTSSSFCSMEQGSFRTFFSACSDWNFASSRASSCFACGDLGKIRNTSIAVPLPGESDGSLYARFRAYM